MSFPPPFLNNFSSFRGSVVFYHSCRDMSSVTLYQFHHGTVTRSLWDSLRQPLPLSLERRTRFPVFTWCCRLLFIFLCVTLAHLIVKTTHSGFLTYSDYSVRRSVRKIMIRSWASENEDLQPSGALSLHMF